MHVTELHLSATTRASLAAADIETVDQLVKHSADDLLYRLGFDAYGLFEIVCRLNQRALNLTATPHSRMMLPNARNREMLRLRIIDGLAMWEIGERTGVSRPRVEQILTTVFGLHGTPPAVKARGRQKRKDRPGS
jgi:hypothetical protein